MNDFQREQILLPDDDFDQDDEIDLRILKVKKKKQRAQRGNFFSI